MENHQRYLAEEVAYDHADACSAAARRCAG
jgi:hypothetical protein